MSRFLHTALLALVMTVSSQAAIVTFDFTTLGNGVLGDPATVSQASMSSGVNYTANLQLDGSGTILTDSNGLGLITGSTFEINNTESLLFTMSPTTAVSGGLATFNGFTSISFTEFDAGDSAEINGTSVNSNGTLGLANVATINAVGTGDAVSAEWLVSKSARSRLTLRSHRALVVSVQCQSHRRLLPCC